ncbi:MAG: phosphatidate cytidylyltransferase, partial [Bacillota bacterium]
TVVLLLFGYLVKELAQEDTQVALVKTGVGLLGLVYPGVLLSYIVLIRQLPEDGLLLTIFTYIVTWSCDTGAYFVGITCGRHKLAPKISPNKTIEGAVGGVLIGSAVGTVYLLLVGFPVLPWAVLALMGSIISLLGDLFESLLKRGANLKDSGDFLPGHGGVLDRFDSMMFVAPLIYYGALFFS